MRPSEATHPKQPELPSNSESWAHKSLFLATKFWGPASYAAKASWCTYFLFIFTTDDLTHVFKGIPKWACKPMKNLAMCLYFVLWLRNLNLIVDNKRCTTIFTTRIGDMLLFSNHWNPIKWVPDGLPWVRLYHPGAVEVVVVGSRVSWRQDASWSGGVDPPTTFRCKGFKKWASLLQALQASL